MLYPLSYSPANLGIFQARKPPTRMVKWGKTDAVSAQKPILYAIDCTSLHLDVQACSKEPLSDGDFASGGWQVLSKGVCHTIQGC